MTPEIDAALNALRKHSARPVKTELIVGSFDVFKEMMARHGPVIEDKTLVAGARYMGVPVIEDRRLPPRGYALRQNNFLTEIGVFKMIAPVQAAVSFGSQKSVKVRPADPQEND